MATIGIARILQIKWGHLEEVLSKLHYRGIPLRCVKGLKIEPTISHGKTMTCWQVTVDHPLRLETIVRKCKIEKFLI